MVLPEGARFHARDCCIAALSPPFHWQERRVYMQGANEEEYQRVAVDMVFVTPSCRGRFMIQ